MKVAIAQLNCVVGDIAGNVNQIQAHIQQAKQASATMLITPELSICGYCPEDLLLRDDFITACEQGVQALLDDTQGITLIVGHPVVVDGRRYNAASVLENGKIIATYHKQALPNYQVFDEKRYFEAGEETCVFTHQDTQVGLLICEDVWLQAPAAAAKAAGAEWLIALNASPYHLHKQPQRYEVLKARVAETGLPIVYVNMTGGQDELVFDGASCVVNQSGEISQQLPLFEATIDYVSFVGSQPVSQALPKPIDDEAAAYAALTLGLKDYMRKNGFKKAVLGLSGGVDSALTLAIAVDALGADNVHAVMMPSNYTASISVEDAKAMATGLGVKYTEIAIKPMFDAFLTSLAPSFDGLAEDTTEENIQARIRGMLLMSLSNKFGSLVLTTGNKSEMAVGYCTLYGDMAGGFAVLKDVAKTLVYRLCWYRNSLAAVIPERIITRAPSAELRPDQTDQDSLPPYEVLDAIIEAYVEEDLSIDAIVAKGFDRTVVKRVIWLIDINEYKRQQAAVGTRITHRGFGKDRRLPITVKKDYDIGV